MTAESSTVKLYPMSAKSIGSGKTVYPPLFFVYVDGVYSGHVGMGKHDPVLLFRRFHPTKIAEIEDEVRKIRQVSYAKAVMPPNQPTNNEQEENDWQEEWE